MVVSVKDRVGEDIEGLMVAEVAELRRTEPASVVADLLVETELRAGAITFSMSEENMRRVLKKPYVMIGSDAWAVRAKPGQRYTHPRAYGTFPRVLGRLVRDGTLSLPEAIHKMTGMPAETFHLTRRGLLREGWFADIVVFDPERILDLATYQEPHQYPVGIEYVIVNGMIAVGAATGECAGRVLRGTE
jgi:N-acyl-D-amino-acid deacylase